MTAVHFILGTLLILGVILWMLKRSYRKLIEEVSKIHPEHTRLISSHMANLFGIRSSGMKQIRGNGILLLTSTELYFRMLLPSKEIIIPVELMISVSTPGSFLGKTKGAALLCVEYGNAEGGTDSAAWLVDRLDEWICLLDSTIGK